MYGGGGASGPSRGPSMAGTPSRLSTPSPAPSARQSFPKLLSDKYRLGEELGRGAYGQVYRGMDTRTGQHVAIKQLSLERIPAESLQGIMNEVELLKDLNHRNIVKYLGSFRTKTHLYIILEYMENGALSTIIKQNKFGPFPESLVAVYIQQVLQGLAYLHGQGVVHRDIKGANILTTKEGLVKLADFGVAAKLGELEAESAAGREAAPVGTPYWMAPEVVEMKSVTTAADIWSVGCLAIELLTGNPPYYDLQPMSALYNIVQDPHPPLPPDISLGMADFLIQCFHKEAAQRPSARELLQHSWITYNRRTLRSSWSRTRGMKARGIRTDAHATVNTVVERMLQAETEDSDAVAILEQQQQQAQSPAKAVPLSPPPPMPPQQSVQPVALQQQPPAPPMQQQPVYQPQPAAQQPIASPAPTAPLGPLGRASQFRVPPLPVPTSAGGMVRGALGVPVAGSDSASSMAQPGFAAYSSANSSPVRARPGGPLAAGVVAQQPQAQLGAAPSQQAYMQQQPQQQYQQYQQQQQPQYAGQPLPSPSQQQQAPAAAPAQPPLCVELPARDWPGGSAGAALQSDPTGNALLSMLEEEGHAVGAGGGARAAAAAALPSPAAGRASAGLGSGAGGGGGEDVDAQARQNVVEVQRQVSSMRACAPGERNMVQEAAAAASAKALVGYVRSDPGLKAVFVAADGLSALLELLDCPSERVLSPALDLLLALVSNDAPSLAASAALGLAPAALRLARPGPPLDVRLAAARYLEALCCTDFGPGPAGPGTEDGSPAAGSCAEGAAAGGGVTGVPALVAAGGVGGLLALVDEEGGGLHTPQQLLMLHIAVSCLWAVLHHAASPGSQLTLNQCLRLMSQQGAAAKLVRVLPRVMQERSAALEAWRASAAARHHARSTSVPQTEAELSLLSADSLVRPGPATIAEDEPAMMSNGSSSGEAGLLSHSSSSQRLGRTLQTGGGNSSSSAAGLRKLRSTPTGLGRQQEGGGSGGGANPEAEAAHKLGALLEALVNLLAVMAQGDSVVKGRLCGGDTLRTLFTLSSRLDPPLQLRLLRAVHALSGEKEVLGQLEEAGAVPWLVAQLLAHGPGGRSAPAPGGDEPAAQAEALGALHNLCQLSRSRQEQAAVAGAPAALCALALASPLHRAGVQALPLSTRSLAVSTLCTLAHGGPRTLEELRAAGCIDTLLALLREEAYQEPVLEALAAWLDADTARVEHRLLEPAAITRLVSLLPTMATAGDFEALSRLLAPLLRLLARSPRLCTELAQNGLAPRVMELLKKPNAHTCLALLAILKAMYEHHPHPKEFLMRYRVQQTLHALAHGQSAREAVLVRKQAQNLLEAFQINLVF